MPKKINGKKMTKKEEQAWKKIFKKTGKGGIATAQIKKQRRKK